MEKLPLTVQTLEYFNAIRTQAETRPAIIDVLLGCFMLLAGIFFAVLFIVSIAIATSEKRLDVLIASAICGFACFASTYVGLAMVRRRVSKNRDLSEVTR
jgi:hypothetical protein